MGGRKWFLDVVAGALLLLVAITAWEKTHDLEWPCEADLYRDLGAAQTIHDGAVGADPAYRGERWWYPPLVPATVALIGRVTEVPLHRLYATAGIYLNLLAPIAFYVMLGVLHGRRVALASLVGFLFLGQHDLMSWMHATYSPWLWSCNLAQAFFYLGVLMLSLAMQSGSTRQAIAAGLFVGMTALAHVAPAMLLAGISLALTLRESIAHRFRGPSFKLALRTLLLVAAVAAVVSSPFWWALVGHYQLRVKNEVPLRWLASELTIERFGELVLRSVSLRGIVAAVGVVGLFWPRGLPRSARRSALGAWGVLAGLGLTYGYVAQRTPLPPLIPSWHFYFYLQALEAVLFGIGTCAIARWTIAAGRALRRVRDPASEALQHRAAEIAIAALLLVVGFRWERYAARPDLVGNREASLVHSRLPAFDLYRWALRRTKPGDVILTDPGTSFWMSAAGRKVVALDPLFSNPYVVLEPRTRDSATMREELAQRRFAQFSGLAEQYRVRYVTLPVAARDAARELPELRRVFKSGRDQGTDVYRIER